MTTVPDWRAAVGSVCEKNLDDIVNRLMTRTSHQVFNQRVAHEICIMRRVISDQAREIAALRSEKGSA